MAKISSERKYGYLRLIYGIFKVLAILSLIVSILGFIFAAALAGMKSNPMFSNTMNPINAVTFAVLALLIFIVCGAFSQVIFLFLDIEENTRLTKENTGKIAELMKEQVELLKK